MKKRTRIVSGLAALAALFLAPLAQASLSRVSVAERAIEAPALTPASAPELSEFSLFEGTELAAAAAESGRAPSFHPLAAVSLLDERVQRGLATPLEASYPKTRYRVFDFLGAPLVGIERGVTLELHWRSASFSCGLASGTVGWLSQDPLGDVDSPNLYGFVGMRPHEKTDPMGLFELPEGPLTTSYNAAVSEVLSPGNSVGERVAFGILAALVAPAAGLEQAVHGFLATPERLNRNIPAVVRETKAAIAATDTDTKLRHGAAALGAGSQTVLDVTVIAALAKSAATATVERELARAAPSTPAPAAEGGILESAGASPRGSSFVSAHANTSRGIQTAIRPDVAESQAYGTSLQRGEIGLQRPVGANVPGPDFITATRDASGRIRIIVTDVKSSGQGVFPKPATDIPISWGNAVRESIAPGRLDLSNSALEAEIRAAFSNGRVVRRQVNVDYSPAGQGQMSGF